MINKPITAISAVMITYNSERMLAEVLQSLAWCDEIVIVDSGSTDRTLAIAQEFGCRVMHRDFDGFGTQKGFAVRQAKNDWVFVVDADEVVTTALRDEICQRVGHEWEVVGYKVPISLVFLDRLMRYGGEYKMPHLRLFNRQYGTYNVNRVHEDVLIQGKLAKQIDITMDDGNTEVGSVRVAAGTYTGTELTAVATTAIVDGNTYIVCSAF